MPKLLERLKNGALYSIMLWCPHCGKNSLHVVSEKHEKEEYSLHFKKRGEDKDSISDKINTVKLIGERLIRRRGCLLCYRRKNNEETVLFTITQEMNLN